MYSRTSESVPAIYVNAKRIHEQYSTGGRLTVDSRMALSTSHQQFLASETRDPELEYGRKGGFFVSKCVCCLLVLVAIVAACLVGVVTFYLSREKSLFSSKSDIWSAEESTQQLPHSPDLRLPKNIIPSFYRLKLVPNLNESKFSGEVYITLKTKQTNIKQIILHSRNLDINKNAVKITEQVYENIKTNPGRWRRDLVQHNTIVNSNKTIVPNSTQEIKGKPLQFNQTRNDLSQNNQTNEKIVDSKIENKSIPIEKDTNETVRNNEHQEERNKQGTIKDINDTKLTSIITPKLSVQVTRSNTRKISIVSVHTDAKTQRLIINLENALRPNTDYTLELKFNGNITDSLNGFYKSTYKDTLNNTRVVAVTHFEPVSARGAFPCFDEPEFRAMFEISIAHPDNMTALSNMPVSSKEPMTEKPGWSWTHFDRSVKMSTYLVAYGVVDFVYLETSYKSTDNETKTIRVWGRKELIDQAKYALNITPKILSYYEEWFGLPYALKKMDLMAVPDLSPSAMENWGLVTFREDALFYNEDSNLTIVKQAIATNLAHELAHQWFGNLVTMAWWNDLWLNEGFATYVQHLGVAHLEPNWGILENLAEMRSDILREDALQHTTSLSLDIHNPEDIQQMFSAVTYRKGASLIQWLNHTITEELFRRGLFTYLNKWKYGNSREEDLWWAMSEAVRSSQQSVLQNVSLAQFMKSWSRQAGYPVLTATLDPKTHNVTFTQNLFSTVPTSKSRLEQKWIIPVSYTRVGENASEWDTKPKLWLKERAVTVNIPVGDKQALYVNVDNIGYYRVNYDTQTWRALSRLILTNHTSVPETTRAQLIDDAFNLAKVSAVPYGIPLNLTTYMRRETSKLVWGNVLNNLIFIRENLRSKSFQGQFEDYILHLISPMLRWYSYGKVRPSGSKEELLVDSLLRVECDCGAARCQDWALQLFQQWRDNDNLTHNPIETSRRELVYATGVERGARRDFRFVWRAFTRASDPAERARLLLALTHTRDESLTVWLLERSFEEIPADLVSVVWSPSPHSAAAVRRFLLHNWPRVYAKFGAMDFFVLTNIFESVFSTIYSKEDLDEFKQFVEDNMEQLKMAKQTILQLADHATLRINWIERHAQTIADWLQDFKNRDENNTIANKSKNVTEINEISSVNRTNIAPEVTASTNATASEQPRTDNTTAVPTNGKADSIETLPVAVSNSAPRLSVAKTSTESPAVVVANNTAQVNLPVRTETG